jgi:hypothetical protein
MNWTRDCANVPFGHHWPAPVMRIVILLRMRNIVLVLVSGLILTVVSETCCAAIWLEGMTKDRAEKELGVVIKREFLGLGGVTNEAGLCIEFAPKDKLERFMFVTLDIYLERPNPNEHPITHYRRLTSVTLKPVVQTKEKIRVFFSVDPQFLDNADISIRVDSSGKSGPDGYSISLHSKDFPAPKAKQARDSRLVPSPAPFPRAA